MTLLIRPDNGQPGAFLEYHDGMVALDTTCITPAKRWWLLNTVQGCNPTIHILAGFDSGMVHTCEQAPMHIFPMPAMYPRDVFLGIANGILERAKGQVVINLAVADSQLPEVKKAA